MMTGWQEITRETHDPLVVVEDDRLVPPGVPGSGLDTEPGEDLSLSVHAVDLFCDRIEVFRQVRPGHD